MPKSIFAVAALLVCASCAASSTTGETPRREPAIASSHAMVGTPSPAVIGLLAKAWVTNRAAIAQSPKRTAR